MDKNAAKIATVTLGFIFLAIAILVLAVFVFAWIVGTFGGVGGVVLGGTAFAVVVWLIIYSAESGKNP